MECALRLWHQYILAVVQHNCIQTEIACIPVYRLEDNLSINQSIYQIFNVAGQQSHVGATLSKCRNEANGLYTCTSYDRLLQHLIWVYTVCKGLSFPIFKVILVVRQIIYVQILE